MSFDIPLSVEREVERYAQEAHLSTEQAVLRLLQEGLRRTGGTPAAEGLGMFNSPEDAALMDFVIEESYRSRGLLPSRSGEL